VTASSPTPDGSPESSPSAATWWGIALAIATLMGGAFLLSAPSLPAPAPDHPLPECPSSPNCERASSAYDVPAETLFAATRRALEQLAPATRRFAADSLRAAAVYCVGGLFKDDVTTAVTPTDSGAALHIRSASRTGQYDFEVNRRRVHRLLDAVERKLSRPNAEAE